MVITKLYTQITGSLHKLWVLVVEGRSATPGWPGVAERPLRHARAPEMSAAWSGRGFLSLAAGLYYG